MTRWAPHSKKVTGSDPLFLYGVLTFSLASPGPPPFSHSWQTWIWGISEIAMLNEPQNWMSGFRLLLCTLVQGWVQDLSGAYPASRPRAAGIGSILPCYPAKEYYGRRWRDVWTPPSPRPHTILPAVLERHCALLHPTEEQQRLSQSFRTAAAVVSPSPPPPPQGAPRQTRGREFPKVQKVRAPRFESWLTNFTTKQETQEPEELPSVFRM